LGTQENVKRNIVIIAATYGGAPGGRGGAAVRGVEYVFGIGSDAHCRA